MPNLPLVLAGPIVRRADAHGLSVWVATAESVAAEARVFESAAGGEIGHQIASGSRSSVQLAPHLHVVVVTARPEAGLAGLPWGETVFYDVRLRDTDGAVRSLGDEGVLGWEESSDERLHHVAFPGQPLPSVRLPVAARTALRFLQGSCRKAHGKGREMLGAIHETLAFSISEGRDRPQALFLTGDQVYADDVDDALFDVIGHTIGLVAGSDAEREHELAPHRPLLARGRRQEFVEDFAGFSSSHAASHLVTLLEYYAAGLLAWSDVLWRERPEEARTLQRFTGTLPDVRRVLANVATYMSFDDHEVTDDWNRSAAWLANVSQSDHGQRIVRNALCAFAVFQQWGNAPDDFEGDTPGARLLAALDGWDGRMGEREQEVRGAIFVPRGGQTLDDLPEDALRWSYRVDTPCARIFGFDTRTRRQLEAGASKPGIVRAEALDEMLPPADPGDARIAVVVSPVPVLGIRLIERLQSLAGTLGLGDRFDVEPWGLHRETFDHLLERLADYRRCIILSGDIHFSFSSSLVGRSGPHAGARIVNYTSSALLNVSLPRSIAFVLDRTDSPRLESVGFGGAPVATVPEELDARAELVTTAGAFEEEILVEPLATLESVDGSTRRVAAIGEPNFGDLHLDEARALHRYWWWSKKEGTTRTTDHPATFPPADD